MPVGLEELQKPARALIGKSEDDPVLDPVFRRILRDAPEDREPTLDCGVDGHQIAGLHVGEDALPRGREGHQVPSDVALDAQRQVEERVSTTSP